MRAIGPPNERLSHSSRSASRAPGRRTAAARRRRRSRRGCAASRPCRSRPRAGPCRRPARRGSPADDPPADRGVDGFRVVPKTLLNVCDPAANSGTLVLPIVTDPGPRIRSTTRSSASGTWSAYRGEPYVVRQPATSWVSLKAWGSPCSGPRAACGRCLVGRGGALAGPLLVEADRWRSARDCARRSGRGAGRGARGRRSARRGSRAPVAGGRVNGQVGHGHSSRGFPHVLGPRDTRGSGYPVTGYPSRSASPPPAEQPADDHTQRAPGRRRRRCP